MMFSSKTLTPLQLSFFAALLLSVLGVGIHFYFLQEWLSSLVLFILILGVGTWFLHAIFQYFIQRQIRLIYKLILQTRTNRKESFYYNNLLPPRSIEEVREDVEEWTKQYNQEIEILQRNEQYRKEFLQNLSHELKTPIFSIQGYLETLLGGALENASVNRTFLMNASKNVDRLVNLADDLDQITKLEIGELKLNPQAFSIEALTQEVFDSFSLQCMELQITCGIKKDGERGLSVIADKEKIRQVLTNLIDNAIKYGKHKGTIEAGFYKIDKKTVLVEIRDDGDGISEEHRQRIFERFYRTDHARSRKVGGSGLGLAICKHIIEAHQQTIYVRSAVQVGSTFCFSLTAK